MRVKTEVNPPPKMLVHWCAENACPLVHPGCMDVCMDVQPKMLAHWYGNETNVRLLSFKLLVHWYGIVWYRMVSYDMV